MKAIADGLNIKFPRNISAVSVVAAAAKAAGQPQSVEQAPAGAPAGQEMLQQAENERNRLRSALAAMEQGAEKLAEFRQKMLQEVEEQLLELATGIAKKVLMQEIQAGRYDIEPIVKEALCHVPARQDLVIRLNPQDHAQCEMARQGAEVGQVSNIRFIADPSIRPAECVIETAEGVVQSSVEAHLEDVSELLKAPEQVRGSG